MAAAIWGERERERERLYSKTDVLCLRDVYGFVGRCDVFYFSAVSQNLSQNLAVRQFGASSGSGLWGLDFGLMFGICLGTGWAGVNWNSLDRDAHGSYFAKGVVEKGLFCHYAGWVQTTSDPTRSEAFCALLSLFFAPALAHQNTDLGRSQSSSRRMLVSRYRAMPPWSYRGTWSHCQAHLAPTGGRRLVGLGRKW